MQYKLDLWSKYGFDLKRLLLPQLPLDRHLNVYIASVNAFHSVHTNLLDTHPDTVNREIFVYENIHVLNVHAN